MFIQFAGLHTHQPCSLSSDGDQVQSNKGLLQQEKLQGAYAPNTLGASPFSCALVHWQQQLLPT